MAMWLTPFCNKPAPVVMGPRVRGTTREFICALFIPIHRFPFLDERCHAFGAVFQRKGRVE
jgi:hypothetical protein